MLDVGERESLMKRFLGLSVALACALAAHGGELAADVTVSQDADSRLVTVSYTLARDAVVTVSFTTNGVALPRACLRDVLGDVNKRVKATGAGETRRILWKPTTAWQPLAQTTALVAHVRVWPDSSPPDYLLHDLRTMCSSYYETEAELPYGPVTNAFYKSYALVMRKIPAAGVTWWMGDPSKTSENNKSAYRKIFFDHDYYFSVFEVTVGQNKWMTGQAVDDSEANCRPASSGTVSSMNTSTIPAYVNKTGLAVRLPTSAEWEYACRAGTAETRFCPDIELADYARIPDNSDWNADHSRRICSVVGTRKPNPWGLYDMLGNMNEYTSDWSGALTPSETAETNPTGPASGTQWVYRGGSFMDSDSTSTSFFANGYNNTSESLGFRLVLVPQAE